MTKKSRPDLVPVEPGCVGGVVTGDGIIEFRLYLDDSSDPLAIGGRVEVSNVSSDLVDVRLRDVVYVASWDRPDEPDEPDEPDDVAEATARQISKDMRPLLLVTTRIKNDLVEAGWTYEAAEQAAVSFLTSSLNTARESQ